MSLFSTTPILHFPRPGRLSDALKAVRRPPDIDQSILERVLDAYNLGLSAETRNLPNTRRNHNLVVHTASGKKVVKRYRADWKPETILFEHSILARLEEIGFPAPRLTPLQGGGTSLVVDGSTYCLFDFMSGSNYSSSFLLRPQRVRMMATAGATLARLHRGLQGFLPGGKHHLGFRDYSGDRWRDFGWYKARVNELSGNSLGLNDPVQRSHTSWLSSRGERLLAQISRLGENLGAANLPRLIIHGDYGLHNLLYQNLDQAVPVDFELARIEWRLCDVVSVVSKFRYKKGGYDLESITNFLRAYHSEFPIDADEWKWLPQVWDFYKLTKAVQYWGSFFETKGPTRKLISARDEIQQVGWAQENFSLLSAYRGAAR